eukprot:5030483-Prymnesium_polylepis.1
MTKLGGGGRFGVTSPCIKCVGSGAKKVPPASRTEYLNSFRAPACTRPPPTPYPSTRISGG